VDANGNVFPVLGPQPAFPSNAPCWLAKGPGNIWYSGNSPGQSISIFFSDGQGGVFYKSVPLPGTPTDIAVSPDNNRLAVIYTAADGGHVAVFAIDAYGDLTPVATSPAIGVPAFSGVAFSD
jgi:6-phosphogluconolactonase (cycloisomerase 2 family)